MKKHIICEDEKKVMIVCSQSSPSKNTNCVEDFDQIVLDLQPKYKLGYNGTYEPAPICNQPIDALPFNSGLKPCTQIIPV